MNQAQTDIAAIADWLAQASRFKKAPMSSEIAFGPYATILPTDPDTTDYPDVADLAEGGAVFFVPTSQLVKVPVPHLDMKPEGHPVLVERIRHLFTFKLGGDLPDVWTLAIANPATSISDVLAAEGLAGLDLDAVAILAVPIWTLPAEDRATVADLCWYP
ncbi:hypothetical protein ACSSNL_15340 [Thalassobius sp. S69A]|uniref:hypothetical protein n=1 Tax=unclassified Thalassovita TaxID=2619711 RepID=UPI003C7E7553